MKDDTKHQRQLPARNLALVLKQTADVHSLNRPNCVTGQFSDAVFFRIAPALCFPRQIKSGRSKLSSKDYDD